MTGSLPAMDVTIEEIATLEAELRQGLERFWEVAATILEDGAVRLVSPEPTMFSLKRNFFTTLFLYSYYRAGIPTERRILYTAVNQCLRGMVTGCDNLLDDEYKVTLETNLPPQAHRFRSVLDIMVADRALFALLANHCRGHNLSMEMAVQASAASLQALARSGAQEASEEGGISERLGPDDVLDQVHRYKTAMLFQSTWAVPLVFEKELGVAAHTAQQALYDIGIGCQILDDIVDLTADLRDRRHNYVASILVSQDDAGQWRRVQALATEAVGSDRFYDEFPHVRPRMTEVAMHHLEGGLRALFFERHQGLVRPAAAFIAERIGVPLAQA